MVSQPDAAKKPRTIMVKRALVAFSSGDEPPASRSRFSQSLLEKELETLKSELEHERSLRELDKRKAQQDNSRLERQIRFLVEEADEAKQLLADAREKSEEHIKDLRESRVQALRELRECQDELAEFHQEALVEHDRSLSEMKISQLNSQLKARSEEVEALKERLEQVTAERLQDLGKKEEAPPKAPFADQPSSPAPKAVMKELNRTRIELAETERKYRQLRRRSDEWQQKAQQYVHQKETARAATARATKLEHDLREVRKELEGRRATNDSWDEFAKELGMLLKLSNTNVPPEVSTVLRHLQRQIKHTKSIDEQNAALQREVENSKEKLTTLERELRDARTGLTREKRDGAVLEDQLNKSKQQVDSLRAQEAVWKRETNSLRSLLKTFDDILPQTKGEAVSKAQEISLKSAREEVKVLKQEIDRVRSEAGKMTEARNELQTEHDRVLDKFSKLKDALMDERAKAEKAEERACRAEGLAGKGAFNQEESRALHLEKNPLSDAVRDRFQAEIKSLRRRLEEATGEKPPEGVQHGANEVDPEKLHQRLKDTFKEQISVFREGVYLISGFKIDMLFDKGGSPYFKVRSVYGEREEDALVFYWPKGVKQPSSLDLGATDFAKVLSTTDSYKYLTKFDSMPAFMASTQLSLFEKCTFVAK